MNKDLFTVSGNLVDIHQRRIYPASIEIEGSQIRKITPITENPLGYILPGFIDAHVHIESSMLIPSEFARLAVVHGTVGTVSDPHEIANVMGLPGVEYMLDNGSRAPFKFYFGAPSCVPATVFETSGATLDPLQVDELLSRPAIHYLSEMMNFPGVLHGDPEVYQKLAAARLHNKPVDGHSPGLMGDDAVRYIRAGLEGEKVGISTDHECTTREEALGKLKAGMKILIREGSAAKNFEALIGLLPDHPEQIMFCSDDKHPDSLVEGHINILVKRALAKGIDLFTVLRAACLNPVLHYKMDVGLLREGDPADFIVVEDLENLKVLQTFINGRLVAREGKTLIGVVKADIINHFNCTSKTPGEFNLLSKDSTGLARVRVIKALDGQLVTQAEEALLPVRDGLICSAPDQDILQLAVVNRYQDKAPALAFIRHVGLKRGAIASSVAHDSHNIIAVGEKPEEICAAVNLLISHRGGICVVDAGKHWVLPLPVAGIMSAADGYEVAVQYTELDRAAKALGSLLLAPFMTLSFMALLVIPHLKLSDLGLFDGDKFALTGVLVAGD